jgi:transposase
VIVPLRWHQPSRDYLTRRTAEGKTTREIRRRLKRFTARQLFKLLGCYDQPGAEILHAA